MEMEKLPMCRICLAENAHMYLVVNRHLHELYEKLTDIPFVTKDSRPMLACFFCCAKLKQCYRLLRQCLQAEELFAQMMNEDYEPKPFINKNHLEFYSGFTKSPIEHLCIDDECQTDNIVIKEELPAVCEGLDDIIVPKEEHQSEDLELENSDNAWLDVADEPPHCSESDFEYDVPIINQDHLQFCSGFTKSPIEHISIDDECQTDSIVIKEELPAVCEGLDDIIVPKEEHLSDELELESLDNSCLDLADIPPHCSESDLEDDEPLIEFKTEVEEEEVPNKKRRASETRRATVAKKPKLDTRRTKLEDAITAEKTNKEKSDSKFIRTTPKTTSKSGTYLKKMIHTRTQVGEKPKCYVCQRSFSTNSDLKKHIRIHTGEKPYKCDVCQRSFNQKTHLTQHIRIHTSEKPYTCEVCQGIFTNKSSLTKHIRIHSGEKPYKCDVCQHSFTQKTHLTQHIRIHTGEKPYKCNVCQHSFNKKSTLTDHIRLHTGEKPYKCDVCPRTFSKKSGLTAHRRLHPDEKPYE